MPQNHHDPLSRAQNSAHEWLAAIGTALGTHDRRYTYRVLRAWLHALRDRLTVEATAHFAAQLPELLRGTYYDGWVPSKVPVRYSADECVERIAAEATIRRADVKDAITGVSAGMRSLLSHGALDHALEQLPRELRALFAGAAAATEVPRQSDLRTTAEFGRETGADTATQLRELRRRVESLADAVATLSHDLQGRGPATRGQTEPDPEAIAAANEVLLSRQD